MTRILSLVALIALLTLLSSCSGNKTSPTGSNVAQNAVGTWQDASLLVDDARNPQIAVDGNGNMIAVWTQSDGLYSDYFDANSGWGTPSKIADRTTQAVYFSNIRVAMNAKGDAVVVWVHDEMYNYFIESVRFSVGSGWGADQKLMPPYLVFSLDIALDANSNALIVWEGIASSTSRNIVYASRSLQNSGWDTPQAISTNVWNAINPHIVVDNKGNAFVFWMESDFSTTTNFYANHYMADSGWGTPELIATTSGSASWANIAFDKAGNAMALWGQSDSSSHYHVYSCRYAVGVGWGSETVIDGNTLNSTKPTLAVDSEGNFWAAWVQFNGTGIDVYSSRYVSSIGWEAPQRIGSGGNAGQPCVAADGLGSIFVAWQQYDINDLVDVNVYVNCFTAASGWGTQRQLRNSSGAADEPELVADPLGHATVIWSQSVGYTSPGVVRYGLFTSRFQ